MPGSIRLHHPEPLAEGAAARLTAPQLHYLGTVMRRRPGDIVQLFNPADGEFQARLVSLRPGAPQLAVEQRLRAPAPEIPLWLVFAPLKRDATDLVLRQATELGATDLVPVFTDRTNTARINENRAQAIAIEAAEQSERLSLPRLHPPARLHDLLASWPVDRPLFAALERAEAPPPPDFAGPAGLLIGPEGGFAPAELDLLRRYPFVTPVGLGRGVLRAETAAVAGLALLQASRRD